MKQKVVIIGHGFASRLAVIRSVAQIDCEITVIVMAGYKRDGKTLNNSKPIDCYSKYVSHVFYCYAFDEEGLIHLLLKKCTDQKQKVVIIPDSDFSAAAIDKNQKRLEEYFLFPHIHHTSGAIVEWMDKDIQKNLARKVGLNVASSCVVSIKNHKYEISPSITYPCFTKPLTTIVGGKKLLRRCNNEKELCELLDQAGLISDIQVLIEDYKQINKEYAIVGFSDGHNVLIPGIIEMMIGSQCRPGITMKGKVMPLSGFEELVTKFKAYIINIGLVGLFDIDFYKSGDHFYFCELNLRFGGSGYAITKMGVNLPAMLVCTLTNNSFDSFSDEIHHETEFVNERLCMEDWYHGFLSMRDYKSLKEDDCLKFIDDVEDTMPMKKMNNEVRTKKIKRFVKKILGTI